MSEQEVEVTQADPEVIAQAEALGWKSPDAWEGDVPAGYIEDPARWVDRALKNPAVQKLEKQLSEQSDVLNRIQTTFEKQFERQRETHKAELDRVREAKKQARDDGDLEAYASLDDRESELREAAPVEVKSESEGVSSDKAIMDRWAAEREWVSTDPVKNAAAGALFNAAKASGLTDIEAILSYVDKRMEKQFLDLAPKPEPQATESRVGGGLGLGGGAGATEFGKLPQQAKDAFTKFVGQGVFEDTKEARAQYAEDYHNG